MLVAAHAWNTLPFIADDALISLRYSRRLIDGLGLTFTDGERVEGYSNLLYVLLSAALGGLGLDLISAARTVGLAGALLCVLAVAGHTSRGGVGAALLGTGLLGASAGLGVWAVGGLEQPLLAGLLAGAWALALQEDRPGWQWAAGGLFALACWTRPDTPVFVAIAAAWGLFGGGWRSALRLTLPGLLAWLAQLGFRLAYYDAWVPNTAHAKLGFSLYRLETGLDYAAVGTWGLGVLVAVAVVGAFRAERRVAALLVPSIGIWLAYVVFIGGDIFPARRHLLPILPAFAMLAGPAVRELRTPVAIGLAVLLVPLHAAHQERWDPEYQRARKERWEWRCATIARAVGATFWEADPLLATNAAGCWPYFSELDSLDMLGLNDRWIAEHPPPDLTETPLAHGLGDGRYVLSREPDLVLMGGFTGFTRKGKGFLGDRQLYREKRFRRDYRLTEMASGGVVVRMWVRIPSPRVGAVVGERGAVVPPWLFAAPGLRAVLPAPNEDRVVETRIPRGRSTALSLKAPAGTWRVNAVARGPLVMRASPAAEPVPDGGFAANDVVTLEEPGRLRIELKAGKRMAALRRVQIRPARPRHEP